MDCIACFIFNVEDLSVLKVTQFSEAFPALGQNGIHRSVPVSLFLLHVLCSEDTLSYLTHDRWDYVRGGHV